ncbi:hypothetical protein ABOM_005653 [Aspergillus bombycis]|uniref:Uncharacterized protein n=1 Tax=Aspergillus bombycis TaxID=109264 RepID=A0A1F8A2X3_9EURO|nr:hypothetical protein ABOM_005653 [Aspergillus bombycis]OGM46037.1 hypothetical protein ABOM_005653 [Aspergillus bombycis]
MLSTFWPHTEYAEDQPFPKLILTGHVLDRSFQAGALLGSTTGLARVWLLAYQPTLNNKFYTRFIIPPGSTPATLLMRSTGTGAVIGLGAMAAMLPYYLARWEPIEWQDRSWRLLENPGQVEVDSWGFAGAVLGLTGLVAMARRNGRMFQLTGHEEVSSLVLLRALGWRNAFASAGMGSLTGVLGYLGWRYGIMGGKR